MEFRAHESGVGVEAPGEAAQGQEALLTPSGPWQTQSVKF